MRLRRCNMFFPPDSIPSAIKVNPQTAPMFPHMKGKKNNYCGSVCQSFLIWELETKKKLRNIAKKIIPGLD